MALLTLTQLRERRSAMSETDLLRRCKDAARLELRGAMYSPDDRLDVAADIMASVLTDTKGSTPSADDRRFSLAVLCGKAKNARRSIDRDRQRDTLAAEEREIENAWSLDALIPGYTVPEPAITMTDAAELADDLIDRLILPDSEDIFRLFYGYARELPGPVVADELDISPNSYDVSCSRARGHVREAFPTAADFLAALVGNTTQTIDPMTGELVWRYVLTDASREAHDRTHILAEDWRDGTDGGSWPTRPETREHARALCEIRQVRAAPATAAKRAARAGRAAGGHDQAQADALRRMGIALARQ